MCLAVPGELIAVDGDAPLTRSGKVAFAGIIKEANLAFVPEALVGDYVLVHAGIAIAVLDAEAAQRSLSDLESLTEEELGEETP